jgi:beta propeller repeat protein
MHSPGSLRALGLLVLLAAVVSGCREHDAGGDADVPDAGDAIAPRDVFDAHDARVDAAPPDAEVDAAPNPNVIELPPSGHSNITAFTNGGFIATYSEQRGTIQMAQDVFYFDVLSRQEVQVTNRSASQAGSTTNGLEILFDDSQFTDGSAGIHQMELYLYSIQTGEETRLTNEVSLKFSPMFNDEFILYKSNLGCPTVDDYNLSLMDRSTGEATVVSGCDQDPETHSISDYYAAWTARPYPGHNKDIFVRDLAAGYTFRIDSTDEGSQYFPSTDDDHVVWQDHRSGWREVYMYTFSTGVEECLTPDQWEQARPHLRDGIVAWCDYRYSQQSGEYGDCDVYVYEIASGVGRRVTTQSKPWWPRYVDSGWIAYAQKIIGGTYKLYMHDLVSDGILTPDGHVIP